MNEITNSMGSTCANFGDAVNGVWEEIYADVINTVRESERTAMSQAVLKALGLDEEYEQPRRAYTR